MNDKVPIVQLDLNACSHRLVHSHAVKAKHTWFFIDDGRSLKHLEHNPKYGTSFHDYSY